MSSDEDEMRQLRATKSYAAAAKDRQQQQQQQQQQARAQAAAAAAAAAAANDSSSDDDGFGPRPLHAAGQSNSSSEDESYGPRPLQQQQQQEPAAAAAAESDESEGEDMGLDEEASAALAAMGLPSSFGGPLLPQKKSSKSSSSSSKHSRSSNKHNRNNRSSSSSSTGAGEAAVAGQSVKREASVNSQASTSSNGSSSSSSNDSSSSSRSSSRTHRSSNGRWQDTSPWLSPSVLGQQDAAAAAAAEPAATAAAEAAAELPVYGRFFLDCHSPSITSAFAVAPKGNRMASGGSDGTLRLWDFGGAPSLSSLRFYRSVTVAEKHRISSVSFGSSSGSKGLLGVSVGDSCCYVLSTDGELLQQTTRGDKYIRDLTKTKGHTHAVQDLRFHPFNPQLFLTASLDATLRIWDIQGQPYGIDRSLTHVHCLKAIDRRGANSNACTCCCCLYTPTAADVIVAGCSDGSLQLWGNAEKRKVFHRPDQIIRDAHPLQQQQQQQQQRRRFMGMEETTDMGCGVAAMVFAPDDRSLYTRGLDGRLCLFDLRKFVSPVFSVDSLPTETPQQGICLSPCGRYVCVSTQQQVQQQQQQQQQRGGVGRLPHMHQKGSFTGSLLGFDALTGAAAFKVSFEETAPICLDWNAATNQLFCSCTNGEVAVCFSPDSATAEIGAARLVTAAAAAAAGGLSKRDRERQEHELQQLLQQQQQQNIFAGDELPEGYIETADGRVVRKRLKPKLREEMFEATQKTKLPPIPSKRGMNGQPGAVGNRSLYMLQQLNLVPSTKQQQQQQQEEIPGAVDTARYLEGVDASKRDLWSGTFVSRAYAATAPKPLISFKEEDDDADRLLNNSKRCPQCGLRCCQCEGRSNKVMRLRE
ncbi:hypothetical protein Emed_004328 [Eimeria media]